MFYENGNDLWYYVINNLMESIMRLVDIVAHKIDKAKNTTFASITPATTLLNKTDAKVIFFAESVRDLYTRGTAKSYGKFEASTSQLTFRRIMERCLNGSISFMDYTLELMDLLKSNMQSQPLATGGYVVFIRYVDGADYLMVVLLKDKSALTFTSSLDLSDIHHIDLDKLHAVVRINPAEMNAGSDTYLSFTNNSAMKELATYFTNFVGCKEYAESRELTSKMVEAVKAFAKEKATDASGNIDNVEREKIIRDAFNFCDDNRKRNLPVNIEALSRALLPNTPTEFTNYIANNNIKINTEFTAHTTALKRLAKFVIKGDRYNFTFDRDCVGSIFTLDRVNKKLIIPISDEEINALDE